MNFYWKKDEHKVKIRFGLDWNLFVEFLQKEPGLPHAILTCDARNKQQGTSNWKLIYTELKSLEQE